MRNCDRITHGTGSLALALLAVGGSLDADTTDEVLAILAAVEPVSAGARREASARIAALGPGVAVDVLALLGRDSDDSGIDQEILLAATAALPRENVDHALDDARAAGAPLALRLGALRVVRHLGVGSDLGTALAIAEGEELLPDELRAAVETILAREPSAFGGLWSILSRTPDALLPAVVDAVAGTQDPRGLVPLGNLLGVRRDALNEAVLAAIATIAEAMRPPFDERVLSEVRGRLELATGEELAAAARAAGRLEDFAALPRLVALLDSREGRVKTQALEALRFASGLDFRSDSRRWASWLNAEQRWWDEEASGVIERLASDDVAEVVASVNAVVPRRLHRNELAGHLAHLLAHREGSIRALACAALGQLGSTVVLEPLVECLDDRDEAVRASAQTALERLTRADVPPTTDAWRAHLDANR